MGGDATIGINQSTIFEVNFIPAGTCYKDIIWHSEDANIATVNTNGVIRGVSNGETFIVATSVDGGFQDKRKIIVNGLNIKQLQTENYDLKIYPNPTSGQLRIKNYELWMGEIEIYDIVGQCVYTIVGTGRAPSAIAPVETGHAPSVQQGEMIIDISHLSDGLYFLKIGNKTVKIIKN
jgi:hypothetical protein